MATLDWIILILFFSCLVGIVFWVIKHKKDNTSDYFLSGRSETWLAVEQPSLLQISDQNISLVCQALGLKVVWQWHTGK
jgi:uncharacterized sodium:solute symporter family permease YidK